MSLSFILSLPSSFSPVFPPSFSPSLPLMIIPKCIHYEGFILLDWSVYGEWQRGNFLVDIYENMESPCSVISAHLVQVLHILFSSIKTPRLCFTVFRKLISRRTKILSYTWFHYMSLEISAKIMRSVYLRNITPLLFHPKITKLKFLYFHFHLFIWIISFV